MNKIPKCKTKKLNPLQITKKSNKICGREKMKIFVNKSVTRSFGQNITNFTKIKDIQKIPKKSSSYNNKVSKIILLFKIINQKKENVSIITNNISNINNRKSILNKIRNNNIITNSLNNTLRGKRVLTWERKSLEKKQNNKDKINNSIINNEQNEKYNSIGNNRTKKNCKILSNRPNSLINQRHTTIYSNSNSNAIHIIKQSLKIPSSRKRENQINKLAFSNPNLK